MNKDQSESELLEVSVSVDERSPLACVCAIPQDCAEAQSPRAPHGAPPVVYRPFELLLRFPRRALADRQLLRNCGDARHLGTDGTMLHVLATPCPCLQNISEGEIKSLTTPEKHPKCMS